MPTFADQTDLDFVLEAYEADAAEGKPVDLGTYLPPESHPEYLSIVVELIRVDLERSYDRGDLKQVEDYRQLAPALFENPERLSEVAFEEYRLRKRAGDEPSLGEYAARFAVDTSRWQVLDFRSASLHAPDAISAAEDVDNVDVVESIPIAGQSFAGFDLIEVLGRGAFGEVYLARQPDLAARDVVLKITAPRTVEPQRLARLQHTNIVPIHSIHRDRGLLAICMPFFGRRTLADFMKRQKSGDADGAGSTLADRGQGTVTNDRVLPKFEATQAAIDSPARSNAALPARIDVIELVLQLADGLAHSHARGIVHSDLKPENVLIADDGTALLLDFNLADDAASASQKATLLVGGTLPYMAPEHLRGIGSGAKALAASDVFSLGVLFYELLTGQRPFASRGGSLDGAIDAMIDDRRRGVKVTETVPRLSPALGAMLSKCLAFSPSDRYSAAELAEDLRRHRADLPLKHTREPSLREQSAKWLRRNQRVMRIGAIAGFALLALIATALMLNRQSRLADLESARAYANFIDRGRTALLHLNIPGSEPELNAIGRTAARQALNEFNLLSAASLDQNQRFSRLTAKEQNLVRRQAVMLLHALAQQGRDSAEKTELEESRRFNAAARALNSDRQESAALLEQQARLESAFPREPSIPAPPDDAKVLDASAPTGDFLHGISLLETEKYDSAVPVWQRLSEEDRQDPVRWFLLGNALAGSGRLADAESCYTAVIALQPKALAGYFNRGMCRYQQRNYEDARDDFTAALRLRPNLAAASINRALAQQALGEFKQAEADATAAIDAGLDDPRAYFVRALIRDALRDESGSATDRDRGFQLPPLDDRGWMARGMACLAADPERARAEFTRGLQEFPNSPGLMKNLIHVCADRLQRPQQALPIIDRLIARLPSDSSALASRAVTYARLAEREKAHRDAEQVAKRLESPVTCLQLACVYALTAKSAPEDSKLAVKYFQMALARQPQLIARATNDPDLESLKSLPEFDSLAKAASQLIQPASSRNAAPVCAD
jgi:serine/threonine protein kinase/Flp pilus assembly protein TadD